MKPLKLRLKGFTGIQKGLGLEEIEIDFSDISGLVALAGDNGRGKSTVLENMTPYNTLASRSGALYQHVYLRNSEKEYSFAYKGDHYRTLLKIDCQSKKSEGFIWRNGISEVNGKITAYAKYITDLLGSENMFFHSAFCAQNAQKLSDMTQGEFKSLLVEFLGTYKFVGWEEDAKGRITSVTGQSEQVEKQLYALNNKLAGYEEIAGKLAITRGDLIVYERDNDTLKKRRVEYQADLEKLRDKKSKQEVLISQKANIEAKIKELEEQLGKELSDNDSELAALRTAYRDFQAQIKENEELIKQADDINAAAERETELNNKIELLTKTIDLTTGEIAEIQDTIHKIEARIQGYKSRKKELANDKELTRVDHLIEQTNQALKTKEDQLSALELRDKDCKSTTCSFIVAALKAQEELPLLVSDVKALIKEKQVRSGQIEKEIADLEEQMSSDEYALKVSQDNFKSRNETNSEDRKSLATARMELIKVKELAGKKTALAVAQTQYDNVTRQMEENVTKGKELVLKWEQRDADLTGSINDAKAQLTDIEKQIDTEIESRIELTTKDINDLDKALADNETSIFNTRALIMKYEADTSARTEVEKELKEAEEEKAKLMQDISDWTYLRNACGKNGLQAMEIDGAAPIITSFANDLLMQAFGPVFTVKFRTINDEGKECLDIIIINGDGEEVLLDNLSGGQKVWCLMALRLAMTLLSQEKSGRGFDSSFSDESDGALDPDNALNYIGMYRAFMQAGKFENLFFISHKPSCVALADNKLNFEKGKAPYWN